MGNKHIFISYRSLEIDFSQKLADLLLKSGYQVWMDRLGGIVPGDDWYARLEQGVNDAFAFVAVLSRNYVESQWCRRELNRADSLHIPIIPAKIGDLSGLALPIVLQNVQHVDFTAWEAEAQLEAALTKLLAGIKQQSGVQPGVPLAITDLTPANPYRTDAEDQADQGIKEARRLEVQDSFAAIEAEEIRKDMEMARKQYQAASVQYRLTLNMADLPRLEAQKATYKAEIEQLQARLKDLPE